MFRLEHRLIYLRLPIKRNPAPNGWVFFVYRCHIYNKYKLTMPQIVDGLKDAYGLNGGAILSGSVQTKTDAFWYYPVTNTVATIKFSNMSGSAATTVFSNIPMTAGNGVYGAITEVTQSSGVAMLYYGSNISQTWI